MTRVGPGWRVAARIARREVRRRPARTALVVALIALPVAGVTFQSIMSRTTTPTAAERRASTFGQADDLVTETASELSRDADDFAAAIAPAYPDGSRIVAFLEGEDGVTRSDGHLEGVQYSDHPLDDPLLEGTTRLTEGRAPRSADEVAVSAEVLDQADAAIGDRIELVLLGEATVTGVIVDTDYAQSPIVVGTAPPTSPYTSAVAYVDAPPGFSAPDGEALQQAQASSEILEQLMFDPSDSAVRQKLALVYVFGGVALATVAVIATAAFAVAARRHLRMLGLLSASGVPPRGLRQVVLLQGTTCGLVGGLLGTALGLTTAALVAPHFNYFVNDYVDGLVVHPLDLVLPLALGIVAATAAAALPARTASRVPVLAALAGRKPQLRLPAAIPGLGLVAVILGLVGLGSYARHPEIGWGYGLVSALAILFGGCALAPWLVTYTEPLARRLHGGARVAARDLARQRLRSGAVVAAIMVPAALSTVTMTNLATEDAHLSPFELDERYEIQDDQALYSVGGSATSAAEVADQLDQVRSILPDATELDAAVVVPTESTVPGGVMSLEIGVPGAVGDGVVGDADPARSAYDLRTLVVNDPDELRRAGAPTNVVEAIAAGQVVVPSTGRLTADTRFGILGTDVAIDRSDVLITDMAVPRGNTIALISPATADRWGLATLYWGTLFQAPNPLNERQQAELETLFGSCSSTEESCLDQQLRAYLLGEDTVGPSGSIELAYDFGGDDGHLRQQAAGGAGILAFTLLVVAVALSLTSAESRDDRALLDAIGAPPRVRQSIIAWQAGLLPALAMVLAVPGGVAVSFAFTAGDVAKSAADFRIPWVTVTLLGLGVPLISAAVAWLVSSLGGHRRRDLAALALAAE